MSHQRNIQRIKQVATALADLREEVVFVGGATVSFYSEIEGLEIRATDDVDVIIEAINYAAHAGFEDKLRQRGFAHDVESRVRCRYKVKGITVDVIPATDVSMGFKNIWYPEGFRNAIRQAIDGELTVKILAPAYFIATKLEAFKNRGGKDPRQSQDFEDIVFVFESRQSIWDEIRAADPDLKAYLRAEFSKLLASPDINEWIDSHVEFDSPPSTELILDRLKEFVGSNFNHS